MNKSDSRVKRTKKMLLDAFKQLLLKNNNYLDITVTELCEKAGLNRRTFYSHYNGINDLLSDIQEDFAINFFKKTKQFDHIHDIEETMIIFFTMTNENPAFEKIILSPFHDYLRNFIKEKTISHLYDNNNLNSIINLNETYRGIIESFYHVTSVACYREWVKTNKSISIKEMAHISANLIKNGLSSFI